MAEVLRGKPTFYEGITAHLTPGEKRYWLNPTKFELPKAIFDEARNWEIIINHPESSLAVIMFQELGIPKGASLIGNPLLREEIARKLQGMSDSRLAASRNSGSARSETSERGLNLSLAAHYMLESISFSLATSPLPADQQVEFLKGLQKQHKSSGLSDIMTARRKFVTKDLLSFYDQLDQARIQFMKAQQARLVEAEQNPQAVKTQNH